MTLSSEQRREQRIHLYNPTFISGESALKAGFDMLVYESLAAAEELTQQQGGVYLECLREEQLT